MQMRALEILGERPRFINPIGIMLELRRIRRDVSAKTDEELLNASVIKSKNLLILLQLLCDLTVRALWTQQIMLVLHCIVRAVRLTLENGNSTPGISAMTSLSVISMTKLGWTEFAHRLNQLGFKAISMFNSKKYRGHVLYVGAKYVGSSCHIPVLHIIHAHLSSASSNRSVCHS